MSAGLQVIRTLRRAGKVVWLVCAGVLIASCGGSDEEPWTTLIDGETGLQNFDRIGSANWSSRDGAIEATQGGPGLAYLVTKIGYRNFNIRVEFWTSDDANSGVFIRCQNPSAINDVTCYEANIFDQRPDQTFGTGAIVGLAPVAQPAPKAGGKWNVFEITAYETNLLVELNGQKTVDVHDARLASGPFALQWGRGTVKFRKVQIRPI